MANPLQQSIISAEAANEHIGRIFNYLGSGNPNGVVNKAYRNAYRGIDHALQEKDPLKAVIEVMDYLKLALTAVLLRLLKDAGEFGKDEAIRQLKHYQVRPPARDSVDLSRETDAALAAILAQVNQQDLTIRALVLTGADKDQILGTQARAGALLASAVIRLAANWSASMVWTGFEALVEPQVGRLEKMAVAVIDDKTTECCLEVHGQVQPIGAPFQLVGEPHFAPEMEKPPFHWNCRTAVALYSIRFDDGITGRTRKAAEGSPPL